MKVDAILTADWHLRDSQPVARTDDYFQAMLGKIKWVSDLQKEYDCPVLHAGDLFHTWKSSPFLLASIMNILPDQFYTIAGNHDLPNHNIDLLEKSGLAVLDEAGKINLLNNYWSNDFRNLKVYGASYGSEIPKILNADILMCHEMVYQSAEFWQKNNGSQALAFLKKHEGYQLIITGHNHKPFTATHKGRLLVNPGSLMRMTADQQDYKPRVYLWNKESNTIKIKYIPIDSEAVQIKYLEKIKERDARMEEYVDCLTETTAVSSLNYEKNLEEYINVNDVESPVKSLINECLGV